MIELPTEANPIRILVGDCLSRLKEIPDKSVRCCVTSPPYWGLRDYGIPGRIWDADESCEHEWGNAIVTNSTNHVGKARWNHAVNGRGEEQPAEKRVGMLRPSIEQGQFCQKCGAWFGVLGLEPTPELFVQHIVIVFREVRRVLTDDGTLWMNMGDSYASNQGEQVPDQKNPKANAHRVAIRSETIKAKDLVGIPWMCAFALRADGWWLRQDIIWCLSGGTWIYVRSQKGDMPMMLRDAARLDPSTVKLWNGERWTQVLGWSRTSRNADELELVLRSGERIGCTPTHQFPTSRGLLRASEIEVGDHLRRTRLPEPDEAKRPAHVGNDVAWFAGLYIAEGSMSENTIQLAGHASQEERFARVSKIAADYGGSTTCTIDGNKQSIRVYGKLLVAILDELVSGRTAEDKCLAPVCWRYGNEFLRSMLDGYLSGDGHRDEGNNRWRLGFTRNYNLERDLRVLAARLGFILTLNPVFITGFGKQWPAFKGEIRFETSRHGNEKSREEVVAIRRSRCREVYDVGVEDEPHLFALASGILAHNSKPNPMPESVTDRCTKSHEYLFLLSKSARYRYDAEAIAEPLSIATKKRMAQNIEEQEGSHRVPGKTNGTMKAVTRKSGNKARKPASARGVPVRKDQTAHLGMPIQKGFASQTSHHPTNGDVAGSVPWEGDDRNKRSVWTIATRPFSGAHFAVMPQQLVEPCILAGSAEGDIVLDPFGGAGTVGVVAGKKWRRAILIELNPEYAKIAENRIAESQGSGLISWEQQSSGNGPLPVVPGRVLQSAVQQLWPDDSEADSHSGSGGEVPGVERPEPVDLPVEADQCEESQLPADDD